jgi:hypothetical protein
MKVTVCEFPGGRSEFDKQWGALSGHCRGDGVVVLPPMSFEEWYAPPHRKRGGLRNAAAVHDAWNDHLSDLSCALVVGSRTMEFGNERYDEGFVWDAEHGLRSVHARGRNPLDPPQPKQLLSDFTPLEVQGIRVAFLIGAEVQAEDEVRRYGREHVDLLVIQRGLSPVPFNDWFDRTREAASWAGAYVVSSHRSGVTDGHGYVLAPDGRVLSQTTSGQAFASTDVELPIPREGDDAQPHPAPDWVDPLITGVPPYR